MRVSQAALVRVCWPRCSESLICVADRMCASVAAEATCPIASSSSSSITIIANTIIIIIIIIISHAAGCD